MTTAPGLDRRIAAWCDRLEIEQVLRRWCRALDRADERLMLATYHPDAIDEHGGHTTDGLTAARSYIDRHVHAFKRHMHLVANVLVELDGDEATAESYLIALLVPEGPGPEAIVVSSGRFLDRLARRGGEWRFARRVWIRESVIEAAQLTPEQYRAIVERDDDASFPHGLPYAGRRGVTDPSYDYLPATTASEV